MPTLRKRLQSPAFAALLISVIVFLIMIGLRIVGSFEFLELAAYDWFIRMQSNVSASDPRITLIRISESDIRNQGRWPLTDATLAQALTILTQCTPRAIGLDIYRDIPMPPGSEELNSILAQNSNIITVMKFGHGGVSPPVVLKDTNQFGFNDILVDPGGIVRRGLLFMDDSESIFYSFALQLALIYLQGEGVFPQPDETNPQYIRLGQTTIPPFEPNDGGYVNADARGYQFLIDFQDASSSFPSYSLTSLLSGKVDSDMISDKVVLIGVMAQSVKDFFYTPHSRGLKAGQQVSGIDLHAQMVNQLIRFALDGTSPIVATTEREEVFWILFWSLMGGVTGLWMRSPWRFAIMGSGGVLILFFAAYLAFLSRWWVSLVPPATSWLISATFVTAYMSNREKKRRALLMQLFSRHVSKEVAETIWQQRDQFLDGGRPRSQKMTVTVLFSDLKGFTSVSEKMEPQHLIDWLNTYMESMAQLVMRHSGVIDDYAGDGIKANFGVPLPRANETEIARDAINAVNCALAMEKEMNRLNALWEEKQLPAVGMRIGIFTGPAVAGPLGSSQRLKYTTVGDTVNVAARLESYDKNLAREEPCRILIGEPTLGYLGSNFRAHRIGEVSLKGKDEKITIYRILGKEVDFNHEFQEVKP